MVEIIAIIANIVVIITGLLGLFTTRRRNIRIILFSISGIFILFETGILFHVIVQNKPVATIITSFSSFNKGYYTGSQQQFYSFPINLYNKEDFLNIEYTTRDDEGEKPVSFYSTYAISSNNQQSKIGRTTIKEINFLKQGNTQYIVNTEFINTISTNATSNSNAWHVPLGWTGINYNINKIYPAKELIFILDFKKLGKSQKDVLKNPPRFLIIDKLEPKPDEIVEQGEELIKNRFSEMKILEKSNGLIWFQRINNPSRGWIILRWEPS